ncbi:hypothetical protein SRHO_G00201220 [Serrasalmus rhombeus]
MLERKALEGLLRLEVVQEAQNPDPTERRLNNIRIFSGLRHGLREGASQSSKRRGLPLNVTTTCWSSITDLRASQSFALALTLSMVFISRTVGEDQRFVSHLCVCQNNLLIREREQSYVPLPHKGQITPLEYACVGCLCTGEVCWFCISCPSLILDLFSSPSRLAKDRCQEKEDRP